MPLDFAQQNPITCVIVQIIPIDELDTDKTMVDILSQTDYTRIDYLYFNNLDKIIQSH